MEDIEKKLFAGPKKTINCMPTKIEVRETCNHLLMKKKFKTEI